MAAVLPPRQARLRRGRPLPGTEQPPPPSGRVARQLAADVHAGRRYVAREVSQGGWLDFGAFRWHDINLARAVRAAVGVITPLVIGLATGRVEYGSFAALGALPAGFITFRGVTRTRVLAVTLTAAGMAVSTFVGATADAWHPWLLVPVVFAWAYMVGLFAALGQTALTVTLQWAVALLIATALPLGPLDAAGRALLVLAGGLWQGVLVVTSWAVTRGSSERSALAQSCLALAGYAADIAGGSQELPGQATIAAQQTLRDPNPLVRNAARQHMLDLAEEQERIRDSLAALGMGRAAGGPGPDGRSLLRAAGRVLTELAAALSARPGQRTAYLQAACRELATAQAEPGTRWEWAGNALLGQLRSACRIIEQLNAAEPAGPPTRRPPGPELATVGDAALTLRASMGTSSEVGRHALRLAVVAALAEAIARASGLSHGYWVVLTVFIVLRPDYSSTLYRGLQRAAGTVVGAGLGVLTVLIGHFGSTALMCGIAVSLVAAYAVFTVNLLLYAVFLTDFVVVLLALLGLPADSTALARLVGTGVGTGLALLAYLLWPTWEGTSASEKFARLFVLQGEFAAATLRAYTRPSDADAERRAQLKLRVRRARIDADASADRLAGEPDHPPMTGQFAHSLTSASHRITQSSIALNAATVARHASPDGPRDAWLQPGLDRLADGVGETMGLLAQTLRAEGAAADPEERLPSLRQLHSSLVPDSQVPDSRAGESPVPDGGRAVGPAPDAGLYDATDGLVDAINTAAYVVRRIG